MTDSGFPLHIVIFNPDKEFDFNKITTTKAVILINNGIHAGEPDGIDASMQLYRDLALGKIKAPKNLNYNILFNDVDKQTFDSIYPYEFNEFEKSFDLITGQSISYFEQLILDNFPNSFFSKDEIDYYLKVLVFASNHPFLSDKRYCFFIARTTKVL